MTGCYFSHQSHKAEILGPILASVYANVEHYVNEQFQQRTCIFEGSVFHWRVRLSEKWLPESSQITYAILVTEQR